MIGRRGLRLIAGVISCEPPAIRTRLAIRFGRTLRDENHRFDVRKWVEICVVKHPEEVIRKIEAEA